MNLPVVGIIDAVDPNTQFRSKEIAVVAQSLHALKNKDLSLSALAAAGDDIYRQALDIESQATRVAVTDDESYARAGALLKIIKGLQSASDAKRKKFTTPLNALKKNVDSVFEEADTKFSVAKDSIEAVMIDYGRKKREAEQAAAAAQRAALEAEAAALAARAEATGNEKAAKAILDAGIEAAASVKAASTAVESHGIKTNLVSPKGVVIENQKALLAWLGLSDIPPVQVEAVVTIGPRALTALIKSQLGDNFKPGTVFNGVRVVELDVIRNY